MVDKKVYRAIGMMSGTSLDGVDVSLIETDGYSFVRPLRSGFYSYKSESRDYIRQGFAIAEIDKIAENLVTQAHIDALKDFDESADIIGFHGQTVFHDPDQGVTIQIGDGQRIADEVGIPVIYDMRSADVELGGQGAPLLPLYHRARLRSADVELPAVILNIGGVSNVTWVAGDGDNDILALDCGPGNALMDDLMLHRTGHPFDEGGAIAISGNTHNDLVARWLGDPYFYKPAPKSLDRDYWKYVAKAVQDLSVEDGLATLGAFTVAAIKRATTLFPQAAGHVYVGGGGRHNVYLMNGLKQALGVPVDSVDILKWDGDALEAEGFAYLAVRSLLGRPLTLPRTTGVSAPAEGGTLARAMI